MMIVLAGSVVPFVASTDAEPATSQTRVTIFARPLVLGWAESAQLYGAATGARPEDTVTIQVKECGSGFFRTYAEAHVNAGGGWSIEVGTAVTSTFRAVWRGSRSPHVTIRQGASVALAPRRAGTGFTVAVTARRSFWRKQVQIQRRQSGAWRTVKMVTLTDSVRSTGTVSATEATFRLSVPRRTQLRALLPTAQAKPCYVQSVSRTVRT
jgi:hypothetical protein